jgi:hypothetical protein
LIYRYSLEKETSEGETEHLSSTSRKGEKASTSGRLHYTDSSIYYGSHFLLRKLVLDLDFVLTAGEKVISSDVNFNQSEGQEKEL